MTSEYNCFDWGLSPGDAALGRCGRDRAPPATGVAGRHSGPPTGKQGGNAMPTYVTLHNFTDEGAKNIKELPRRDEGLAERLAELGCTVREYCVTIGLYDEVVVWEAPSDEVAMAWLLELGTKSDRRSVTLRGFSDDEFQAILETVP